MFYKELNCTEQHMDSVNCRVVVAQLSNFIHGNNLYVGDRDLEKLLPHLIKDNEQIVSLLKTVPQRSLHPSLERFQMYRNALQVYRVARYNEKLPVELKQSLDANRRLKQRIYQMVFEVLHRKLTSDVSI